MPRLTFLKRLHLLFAGIVTCLFSFGGCASRPSSSPEIEWTAYQIREVAAASLNQDSGWAAAENQAAPIRYDAPFRIRFEVESASKAPFIGELRLQYRKEGGDWRMIGLSDFPYPRYATPELSLLATAPYAYGEETEDLLTGSVLSHEEGIGLKGVQATPLFQLASQSTEWEWPLVIRRFYDGDGWNEDGLKFEIRMVDASGRPLRGLEPIVLTGYAAPGHLGGTFIETPARIGPYQSSSGRLYFLMEPTETFNSFMVVASDDHGVSWREIDGAGRPSIGDLEGVGSVFKDGIIHIVHQTSDEVVYHAFATKDSKMGADGWIVDSRLIAQPTEPPTQSAAMATRGDESLVVVYGNESGGFLHLSGADFQWATAPIDLETKAVTGLSGFQAATGTDGDSFVVFTAEDGSGWMRILDAEGALSEPLLITQGLGLDDAENGAILPIIALPSGGILVIYRRDDGSLWERVWKRNEGFGSARSILGATVVSGAVDSDQVGADAIEFEGTVHLLYIDEATRSINYNQRALDGAWSANKRLVSEIDAAWVRGNVIKNENGKMVYGFVYDAGSQGGAGMNRFDTVSFTD
jgi:hypothetical protein